MYRHSDGPGTVTLPCYIITVSQSTTLLHFPLMTAFVEDLCAGPYMKKEKCWVKYFNFPAMEVTPRPCSVSASVQPDVIPDMTPSPRPHPLEAPHSSNNPPPPSPPIMGIQLYTLWSVACAFCVIIVRKSANQMMPKW